MKIQNNKIYIVGSVSTPFSYSHTTFGEKFYQFFVMVGRLSDVKDVIRVIVSERIIGPECDLTGQKVSIEGEIRTINKYDPETGKTKLLLNVFCKDIKTVDCGVPDDNQFEAYGYIVKQPIYRVTPMGRKISDVILAINRPYCKLDYIPCIFWGRNAKYIQTMDVGSHIYVRGRLQSRNYTKKIDQDTYETKTAFEVSISQLEEVKNEN